ncbi:MAG: ABC transporter permease subunit [Verrucomicrobiales bacterium]|nr:ABC transporter permease subunit [Verrucomicrobiales bacterium]
MLGFELNPVTRKRLRRFQEIRRGYYSLIALVVLIGFSLFAELFISNRALIVKYDGKLHFPTYGRFQPGTKFGLDYEYETNYRKLQKKFREDENSKNWVLMPFVPYGPEEENYKDNDTYPPYPPSRETKHYLGTDQIARDVLAQLVYGFRIAIMFSLMLMVATYLLSVIIGCAMGYFGGLFDLIGQRIVEIWSVIPFLYVVIIIAAIIQPGFWTLLIIMAAFSWMGMTYYMRTGTYKEKERDYTAAARVLGAGTPRIIFRHILPNTLSTLVTFIPFTVAAGITSLTALDFLGFGLPSGTPSWGDLLKSGNENIRLAPWIILSTVSSMVFVLTLVTFVGEAIREAFDPKKFTTYR